MHSLSDNSGFTLVEAIIAVALLASMTVALFAGFSFGFGVIQTSREDLRATQILSQKIESLRLCTWDNLSNCPPTFVDSYDPTGLGTSGNGTIYSGTINIVSDTNIPGSVSYQDKIKLITVSVWWTNRYGQTPVVHHRQMQTQSAYNGMQNYLWGDSQ